MEIEDSKDQASGLVNTKFGKIRNVKLTSEMQKSYLDYAMSVIVSRALPDVRDGLKPVHRRILYSMHKMGQHHTAKYTKSAKIVGETMGKYHPHGDGPIYGSLVRMAQTFSMRYPLVDGQGNFGSMDGDPPAAMRYTEAKLTRIADELLLDIEKDTVDFEDNFDGSLKEPNYLPSKLPNMLLAGAEGIAVGMATKIPPHNLSEVVDSFVHYLKNTNASYTQLSETAKKEVVVESAQEPFVEQRFLEILKQDVAMTSGVTVDDLLVHIKGPDFPTAGIIYGKEEMHHAYATGKGKVTVRAKAEIKDIGHGKSAIIATELPYQVNKSNLIAKIANLVRDKKLDGIADLRDESDQRGVQIYIELKRDAVPKKTLNRLFKLTEFQTVYPINMVGLVGKQPQTLTLMRITEEFVKHRHKVIKRKAVYQLREAKRRAHILEGLKIAVDNIDEVIAIIRKASDVDEARMRLMKKFKLSEIQAQAILDMQLKRLAALERKKIEDEYNELAKLISGLEKLLLHPGQILDEIKKELLELKEKYGDKRRSKIIAAQPGSFSDEDLIPNEETFVTITQDGYVKRVPANTYKAQRRGGRGVSGMTTKEEDVIEKIMFAKTHDNILFFTNKGRVFQDRVWELPEGSRKSKGKAVVNIIAAQKEEDVATILTYAPLKDEQKSDKYILLVTKKGTVKKTRLVDFKNIRTSGIIAMNLVGDDQLRWAAMTTGNDDILLATKAGMSIRFTEKDIKPYSRAAQGVRGITLKGDDEVVGMEVFKREAPKPQDKRKAVFRDMLTISEKGIGKRTPIEKFNIQKRGGVGIKLMKTNAKTGKVASSRMVDQETDAVVITSQDGQVIRLPIKNVPQLGRNTQGVIMMRFAKASDKAVSAALLNK